MVPAAAHDTGEAEPIPLSALQHAVYCLRQAALIHLERLWADNRFTAEGDVLHAVADKGGSRKARGVRRVMALPLASERLNIAGVADMVEFHAGEGVETPFPVEYKRGKAKLHRADEVQLCAQALCLEEMTRRNVPEGALYYAETKRRVVVPFDSALRDLTRQTIDALAEVFASRRTPPPTPHRSRCRACSLIDLCRPDAVVKPVKAWRDRMVTTLLSETGELS
ncbi:CRISPR-associated exonuclease Cas4 [Pseudochelatococcus lubricantis]|uniref:CRISPR-associated exonuclease Cas4 n=1 Tax=Pseudochelatococcus lubricantis TaxID=1538102 RepID=A0ABX0UX50_9HYPH|nr:CRISPR-associated protein Cas4 [Pseudochelatococcus lubricantis]NIJ57503.1 CRISPR-associated exonuclease Cas4 [Pseudochelatococcus lubricantis]